MYHFLLLYFLPCAQQTNNYQMKDRLRPSPNYMGKTSHGMIMNTVVHLGTSTSQIAI